MPKITSIAIAVMSLLFAACQEEVFFASEFKTMEVTDTSAIIWTRLYAQESPNPVTHERKEGVFRHPIDFDEDMPLDQMDGGIKGSGGSVKITLSDGNTQLESPWISTSETSDFTASHYFQGLKPSTRYTVTLESKRGRKTEGSFTTAPSPSDIVPVNFTTSTCQYFWSYDDSVRGFQTYDRMRDMQPDFFVQTGDYVYYDKPGPLAKNLETARHKWHAMDTWPSLKDFYSGIPMYMIKDDHDLLKDDISDKEDAYGKLSYADGLKVWYENVPLREKPYRTIRWGKDLQFWLVEGREFRSLNSMEDGPEKTIWGKEQLDWFTNTMDASDATFKIIFSATPIVGPDRDGKKDNHANDNFKTEGDFLRTFISGRENVFIINGDRHWQYHSVDPETGVNEFGSGPVSDFHAQGWNPEDKRPAHQFLRVKGGFLGVRVYREGKHPRIKFTHYNTRGNEVYSTSF